MRWLFGRKEEHAQEPQGYHPGKEVNRAVHQQHAKVVCASNGGDVCYDARFGGAHGQAAAASPRTPAAAAAAAAHSEASTATGCSTDPGTPSACSSFDEAVSSGRSPRGCGTDGGEGGLQQRRQRPRSESWRPPVWPIPLFTPFALVKTPLAPPADFRGRPADAILAEVGRQLNALERGQGQQEGGSEAAGGAAEGFAGEQGAKAAAADEAGGGPSSSAQHHDHDHDYDAEVLHGALAELERLSFKEGAVKKLVGAGAVPVLARALAAAPEDSACKAAVVLWNLAFQLPACVSQIKATDAVESLGALVQAPAQAAKYSASGALSVLTAASRVLRLRCAAVPGCLAALAGCLALPDANVQYHAGGTLYYIALNEPALRPAVRAAGAAAAFQGLLRSLEEEAAAASASGAASAGATNPNAKLARRALACLQGQQQQQQQQQ